MKIKTFKQLQKLISTAAYGHNLDQFCDLLTAILDCAKQEERARLKPSIEHLVRALTAVASSQPGDNPAECLRQLQQHASDAIVETSAIFVPILEGTLDTK